jgi:response regulator RpfG family c-di-GMP phosphodiesterase
LAVVPAARILVASNDTTTLQGVGAAAQPMGYLLFHMDRLGDLASRLTELAPELLVLDADTRMCRDLEALQLGLSEAFMRVRRPQVLLLCREDDELRAGLYAASQADVLADKPVDELEITIHVRALVRVARLAAEAVRDRDMLNRLLEISTSASAGRSDEILQALSRRVAEWTDLDHVVVALGQPGQVRVVAGTHAPGRPGQGFSPIERRHAEVWTRASPYLLSLADGVMAGEDPWTLPYVGLPLRPQPDEIIGVLHLWGGEDQPRGALLRVLQVAAERISLEIRLRETNRQLEEMVEARTADLSAALARLRTVNNQLVESSRDTVMRLAVAAEMRDGETGDHIERVAEYCAALARYLGLGPEEQALIRLAAPTHDVGKVSIPDGILRKRGPLTEEEFDVVKSHTTVGAQILHGSRSRLLQMAEEIAATHHERWDGRGYPAGLTGTAIPLAGRIAALADVFDALTSPRIYKDAWSVDEAVSHIRSESGGHFDPRLVAAFERALGQFIEIRNRHRNGQAGAGPTRDD